MRPGLAQMLSVMPLLGIGKSLRELIGVMGAYQSTLGGVAGGRHRPVVTGCAATPNRPLRVLAPQLLDPGVLASPTPASTHGKSRQAGQPMPCAKSRGIP